MVALLDTHCGLYMAQTSDNLARQYGITREAQDEYALRSQQAAAAAERRGVFAEEIVAGGRAQRGRKTVRVEKDDHLRPDTTREGLAELQARLRQGRVRHRRQRQRHRGRRRGAGAGAPRRGAAPRARRRWARIVAWGIAGVPPEVMGIGPAPATRKALERPAWRCGTSTWSR